MRKLTEEEEQRRLAVMRRAREEAAREDEERKRRAKEEAARKIEELKGLLKVHLGFMQWGKTAVRARPFFRVNFLRTPPLVFLFATLGRIVLWSPRRSRNRWGAFDPCRMALILLYDCALV